MINAALKLPLEEIRAFCQKYPIRKLSLFGSVLRDDFTDESDIDVLVEFFPDSGITFLDLARMQRELQVMMGRDIDLSTPGSLSQYFVQKVLDTALVLYERQ